MGTLQLCQLQGAVHTCHLHFIADAVGYHLHAIGHRHGDDVGQVVLALGIIVVEFREPLCQLLGRHSHDAAVDLVDGAFFRASIFLLHDALHRALGIAHDTAIAHGVVQRHGQQCHACASSGRHQILQDGRLRQRHITREHHHHAVICQHRHGLLHGMACTQLGLLAHKLQIQHICTAPLRNRRFHLLCTMAGNHYRRACLQLCSRIQHMLQQRTPSQLLQHLGGLAFHACALTGSHDDDIERKCVLRHKQSIRVVPPGWRHGQGLSRALPATACSAHT